MITESAGRASSAEGQRTTPWTAEMLRERLVARYGCWERSQGTAHDPASWFRILADALQAEAHSLDEGVALACFALAERLTERTPEAEAALADVWARPVLEHFLETVTAASLATPEDANAYFRELRHHFRDHAGIRGRCVMFPIRAALAGTMVGPCLGITASLLGLERCRARGGSFGGDAIEGLCSRGLQPHDSVAVCYA